MTPKPLPDQIDCACGECGDTGLVRVHGPEDYGVSFESEVCEHCAAGLRHLEPEERLERYEAVVQIAAEYLSMTRCPYFDHQGACDSGCHSEPACVADQPTEGWAGAALKALESVLVASDERQADAD